MKQKWMVWMVTAGLVAGLMRLVVFGHSAGAQTEPRVRDESSTALESQLMAQPLTIAPQFCPESYIELAVDKPQIKVGEHFLLTATYHNLGQPWVYALGFNPVGLAIVDPPFEPPCQLCIVFQLRAVSVGRVEIGMCATGEIYCNGWMWSGACSKTPAVVVIDPAQIFLPLVIQ